MDVKDIHREMKRILYYYTGSLEKREQCFEELVRLLRVPDNYDIKTEDCCLIKSCAGEKKDSEFDVVSCPSHYTEGRKYEPRKVISDWGLNFNLGNAAKYISRAGRKGDKIEDLRKAIQYIEFEIDDMENKEEER